MYIKDGIRYFGEDVDKLSRSELLDEIEYMEENIARCEELGQGISTKESGYYRKLTNKFLDGK